MTCRREVEFIADYLASGLGPLQTKVFETHLKICPDCVAFLKTYKKPLNSPAPSCPKERLQPRHTHDRSELLPTLRLIAENAPHLLHSFIQ
jgi:hypothetical protein